MKVCIAEKPSVARDIADILGAKSRRDGYYEGNGYCVTWVYGHLCELKEPHEYNELWKRWSLSSLPIIPQRFGIKLKEDKGVKKQFKIIESLISQAESVINCGDAGQEGELIQRWVMQKAGCKSPVYRLWISSLTEESIKEGFEHLKPQQEFDRLYLAGLTRAIGDWLLGLNATRLYTLRYGREKQILSVGRVQTPTLALIVNRQLEIEHFVPQPYWELKTVYRDTTFSVTHGRYNRVEDAQEALAAITECVREFNEGKKSEHNLLDLAVKAASVRATLGEISDACEAVVGRYKAVIRTISQVYSSESKSDADFDKACELTEEFARQEGRRPRIMIAKMGQDGHDRGAKVCATGYADCGFDVDMGPLFQTPAEAARQAVENDVNILGVSSLAAGHKTLIPQVIEELKKLGREDIMVIAGGVIPAQDYDFLYQAGVAAIFGPGTSVAKAACEMMKILLDKE